MGFRHHVYVEVRTERVMKIFSLFALKVAVTNLGVQQFPLLRFGKILALKKAGVYPGQSFDQPEPRPTGRPWVSIGGSRPNPHPGID